LVFLIQHHPSFLQFLYNCSLIYFILYSFNCLLSSFYLAYILFINFCFLAVMTFIIRYKFLIFCLFLFILIRQTILLFFKSLLLNLKIFCFTSFTNFIWILLSLNVWLSYLISCLICRSSNRSIQLQGS
jgi:hypothetical protein